jgi:GAF domain-containing protein
VLVAPLAGTPITPGGTPPAVPGPAPGTPAAVLQLLASDPATPAAERDAMVAAGLPSLLRVPVCAGDRHLGTLQAACGEERAWSRHEIRRARIIGHAVGAALARLERPAVEAAA